MLARLRTEGSNGPLARLVELLVEETFSLSVEVALPTQKVALQLKRGLEAWVSSSDALPTLERAVKELEGALKADRRALRALLPAELREGAGKLVARSYSPSEPVVRKLLEPEPVRELIRELTLEVLVDFGRKLRAPVTESRVAKGLTGLAKLAAEQAMNRSGALGALAGGMVTAVSDEVERQVERRAGEFVDAALEGIVSRLAQELSSSGRAGRRSALASAMFDGLLELRVDQVGGELVRFDVPARAHVLRETLGHWLTSPQALGELENAIHALTGPVQSKKVRELLEEHGLLEPARELLTELLNARLRAVVGSEAFEKWLTELFA